MSTVFYLFCFYCCYCRRVKGRGGAWVLWWGLGWDGLGWVGRAELDGLGVNDNQKTFIIIISVGGGVRGDK